MILLLSVVFVPVAAGTPAANATITDAVASGSGEQTVIVRFGDPSQLPAGAADAEPVGQLQMKATSSQDRFERFAAGNPHVEIKDSFWIANAMLVKVDTEQVPLRRVAGVDNVELIHEDFEVTVASTQMPSTATTTQLSPASDSYTWGLNRINVPSTWQQFDNRGDGVTVAVLDTGVDESHPDIDVADWIDTSDTPASDPKDYGEHGTHVSGTIVGGDTSGTHIGVAPNATLIAGAVLTDCGTDGCTGSFSQIVEGVQWAYNNDADIVSMSLGADGKYEYFIDPIQNARQLGTIPVVASGNNGEGTSSSPSNVYDSIAVGASDENGNIASFSSGETIDKTEDWSDPPSEWPDTYVVPDVSTPGTNIESSIPGGGYGSLSGTSMATPHVSGTIALMLSNGGGEPTPTTVETVIEDTAVNLNAPATRQGAGRINASEATLQHSWATLQPSLSPTKANVSVETTLDATVNHPITTYYWTLPNGSTVTTSDGTLSYSFEQRDDSASVEIVLEDIRGENKTTTATVDVGDSIPPMPRVTANRSTAELGVETVQFNASRSTDNDRIDQYKWNFGDGTSTTTDPVVNRTYTSRGSQTLTLTATDAVGNSNVTTTNVEIVDTIKPTPLVTAPESTVVGDQITFDAIQSTDNGNIGDFQWQFEDGTTKYGETISHRFETTGSKTVSLTTTDEAGNTNTTKTTVTVTSLPTVTVTEPSGRSYFNTENISVRYSLSGTAGSEAAGIEYQVTTTTGTEQVTDWQSANFTYTTNPVSNSTTVGPLEDGNYTIEFRIIDEDGTVLPYAAATTNVSVGIKTTVPDTTLTVTPAATEFEAIGPHNPVRINASVTDSLSSTTTLAVTDPTDRKVLSWDLSPETGDGTPVTRTWNGTDESEETVANGQYVINLTATDAAGNTINKTKTVTVDTTNPSVTFSSMVGGRVSNGTRYINDSTTVEIALAADGNGEGQAPVTAVTVDAIAERVNYRVTPTISQTAGDDLQWTGQLDGSTIEDPGAYTLTATATDSANNTKTAEQPLTYDPTPPDLSAVITNVDSNNDQATVSVRSNEPLSAAPTVQLAALDSETKTIELNSREDRWRGTFDIGEGGQYTLIATGVDRAGNHGTDKATTTISERVTTENRTAFVYDESSGLFIRVNTTTPIEDQIVALSDTSVSPKALADSQFGVQFLEGALDTTISDNLANATVGIPVTTNALPGGIEATDDQIQIEHYDNGWNAKPTSVQDINELDGRISGQYWTTTVDSFSSYGVTINDTNPPEIDGTTATLADDEQTVTLTASYSDELSGVNASAITLSVDGTDRTEAKNTSITSSTARVTDYPVNDDQYELVITVEDKAGNRDQYQRTLAVDQPDDNPSRSPGGGGGGGGQGGGSSAGGGANDGAADDAPPTIAEVRSTLNLIDPTSDTTSEISDADPDTPGLQVRPEGTEVVREIAFDNEEVSGSVNVREYNNPPEEIRSSVSQSVSAAGAVERGDVSVLDVADITPDSEAAEESGATVTFTQPADEVDDPDQLAVIKETYDFEQQEDTWTELPTTVESVGEEEITASAQAESFSLFAVAEVQSGTEDEETTNETDSTEEPGDSKESDSFIPGFGVTVAVVAMIALALLARRKRQ